MANHRVLDLSQHLLQSTNILAHEFCKSYGHLKRDADACTDICLNNIELCALIGEDISTEASVSIELAHDYYERCINLEKELLKLDVFEQQLQCIQEKLLILETLVHQIVKPTK